MQYYGNVYRPPSEAKSLIIQCTIGCANNTCKFCYMYKADDFTIRPTEDVLQDLDEMAVRFPQVNRIFLADGDALVLPTETLLEIMKRAYGNFPHLERISIYGTMKDILRKSDEELKELKDAGLDIVYIGLESGSDEVIQTMDKNQTQDEYVDASQKLKKAGLRASVTLLFGLGGYENSDLHIRESARAISRAKPEYVSFLSLQVHPSAPLYDMVAKGEFELIDDDQVMKEMRLFIEEVDSEGTVFRSNHASNPVSIKGTFNEDREEMLAQVDHAQSGKLYRPKNVRGL